MLLQAATQADQLAVPAFRQWRSETSLDDAGSQAHRVMPMLVDLITRNEIDDPDLLKLRGVRRHVWARNSVQLRELVSALDALAVDGIRPMLLKSGALFARSPGLVANWPVGDYDILMPPGRINDSIRGLHGAGFHPAIMSWSELLQESDVISGAALARSGLPARVDFHWRPLVGLHDPELLEILWSAAETRDWQSRSLLVPSPAHHLFLAIGRCDQSDGRENFIRLLEGHMLLSLSEARNGLDWGELERLVDRYDLKALAGQYLQHLEQHCGTELPAGLANRLQRDAGFAGRLDSRLRATPPASRHPLQAWLLDRRDAQRKRLSPARKPRQLAEALLLTLPSFLPLRLGEVRRHALRRHAGPTTPSPRFLEGWFYKEIEGRWTNGRLAMITVPLDASQRAGAPVSIRGYLMAASGGHAQLIANAGGKDIRVSVTAPEVEFDIQVTVKPEPKLGGDGLIVLSMPNAMSPYDKGESADRRSLGFFLREIA